MPPERLALGALSVLFAALVAGCGGGTNEPIRIAVLSDCEGAFSAGYEFALAGAELPLLERGAKLRGPKPSDGISGAVVAGKPVDLIFGCERAFNRATELAELRRLVEREDADVVIVASVPGDGLVARDYAKREPQVTFLVSESNQSMTLKNPAPNMFRFTPDASQWGAGLGAYAFQTLGWRNAVTVAEDDDFGWNSVAGFIAEFCSLGGDVVRRLWSSNGADFSPLVARIPVKGVNGVFLPDGAFDSRSFVAALAAKRGRLARSLVVGDVVVAENPNDARLLGVIAGNTTPWATTTAWSNYLTDLSQKFPSMSVDKSAALADLDAMEPILEALEQIHGDLSHGERRLMAALARLRFESPEGWRRLDTRHQAIGSMYLGRVERGRQGRLVVRQIRVVRNVEQTFGGYFTRTTPAPSRTQPVCKHGHPPPWARSPLVSSR